MNENGERFANLCVTCNLVIGGSFLHHKRIHRAIWVSPDLMTENQIDHVCIGKRFRRSLQDVRVRRGADVASDHHLLVARIELKLKRNWTGETNNRQRYNTLPLNEIVGLEEFKITLANKFQVLQEQREEDTIEKKWKSIRTAVTATCQEILGQNKQNHKEWMTAETLKRIEERKGKKALRNNSRTRAGKVKAQIEYSEAKKIVKRSMRADKRSYTDTLAAEAEEAAQHGNMKTLYDSIKKLSGKFSKPERPINDKEGNKIPDAEGQKRRWAEHFEELLKRPAPLSPADIQPAERDLPIACDIPSKEEIHKAIRQLRNGKAAGPDNIPAEALKADVETIVEMLYPLFRDIWGERGSPVRVERGLHYQAPEERGSNLLLEEE